MIALTFDMRGMTRLAGACPLDGRVRQRSRAGLRKVSQYVFGSLLVERFWLLFGDFDNKHREAFRLQETQELLEVRTVLG